MAEKKIKSKTDVGSRAHAKSKAQSCSYCGKKAEMVLAISSSGKRKMKRACCGQ